MLMAIGSYLGQAKWTLNDKQVTELSGDIKSLKVKVNIPKEILNHELVQICIDYTPDDNSREPDFSYCKEFKIEYLKSMDAVELIIVKDGGESPDFKAWNGYVRKHFYFNITGLKDSGLRTFENADLSVRIYGKDVSGYVWEDDKHIPTYKFENLKGYKIKWNLGAVSNSIASGNKLFEIKKFNSENGNSKIDTDDRFDQISSTLKSSDGSSVKFVCRKVDKGYSWNVSKGYSSKSVDNGSILEDLKYAVERELYIVSHNITKEKIPYSKTAFIDDAILASYYPQVLASEKTKPVKKKSEENGKMGSKFLNKVAAYGASSSSGGTSSSSKDAERFIQNRFQYFDWKNAVVGNKECQVLEIQVYKKSQLEKGNSGMKIIESERGKTTPLKIFVTESKGNYFVGMISKEGVNPLTEVESKFWNFTLDSVSFY